MKRLSKTLFLMLATFGVMLLGSCAQDRPEDKASQADSAATEGLAQAAFEKTDHDFGKIFSGERVSYAFTFTNTGKAPLVITGTSSGCGCTVGEYSKEPIAPGQKGHVTVLFNSAGRNGFQSQTIRIATNADPSEYLLRISGEVIRE